MAKILTITSGKGGVGKTSVSLNLSLSLASKGNKVCLFDADLGLGNVNILTGIYPPYDLGTVISGKKSLNEIIIKNYHGVDIIPGSNGVQQIADLSKEQASRLIHAFQEFRNYDYFIFDTSAGISSQVMSFCLSSNEIILIITHEPTSLTDGYSMLKALARRNYNFPVKVLFNQISDIKKAQTAYNKLKKTAAGRLNLELSPAGVIASDKNVHTSIITQTPFLLSFPDTIASKCIKKLAEKISSIGDKNTIPLEKFWERCFLVFEHNTPKRNKSDENSQDNPYSGNSLTKIESKIDSLSSEIVELKDMMGKMMLKEQGEQRHLTPWEETGRISDEEDADLKNLKIAQDNSPKRDRKPIVRGRLRIPTPEELKNWDDGHYQILETRSAS